MKQKFKDALCLTVYFGIIIIFAALICGLIGIEIYVWVTYANVPITEIPSWALFFMFGGGGK